MECISTPPPQGRVRCHQRKAPFSRQRARHDRAGGGWRHTSSAEGSSMPAAVAVADQTLAQHFYMPNRPLALVERAQAAINNIATQSTLHKGDAGIRCADQPLRISAAHEIHRMGLRGRFGETATERQPEQCQKPERRKDLEPFDAKSLIHMVRLAGIEPTTPWFVAKYSIQLSYSR